MNDFQADGAHPFPSFFYHLGDVVYFFGEATEYYPQFYEPYTAYPAPVFAIPGNHDGDLSPTMEAGGVPSLAAFVNNFCQSIPHLTRDALDSTRRGMTQPNVYWTLDTPLATIIGLYTNVPDGGQLDDSQITWLETELAQAPLDKALLLTMHHPIFSMDGVHSGSDYMRRVLDQATANAHRMPDAVFAGHVHNYQRFTRSLAGRQIPFIVAGAGGYHNLHRVAKGLSQQLPFVVPAAPDVTFEAYADTQYGYLLLQVTPTSLQGDYYTVPGFGSPINTQVGHADSFSLDLQQHTVTTNPAP